MALQDDLGILGPSPAPTAKPQLQDDLGILAPPKPDDNRPIEQGPSLVQRAADGVRWLEKNLPESVSDAFAREAQGAAAMDPTAPADAADTAFERKLDSLGKVDVPYGYAGGKILRTGDLPSEQRPGYDVPGAAGMAVTLGLSAGGLPAQLGYLAKAKTGLGLAARTAETAGAFYAQPKIADWTENHLSNLFPSRRFYARFLKWAASQGLSTIPFLATPHLAQMVGAKGEMTPGFDFPEEPAPEAKPIELKPEAAVEPPEKPALKDDLGILTKTTAPGTALTKPTKPSPLEALTERPEKEPELIPQPGLEKAEPEVAETAPKEPAAVAPETPVEAPETPKPGDTLEHLEKSPVATGAPSAEGTIRQRLEAIPSADVRKVPTELINSDPQRFQYKLNTGKDGVSGSLSDAERFNEDYAGTALLYYDPANEKVYGVNAHNRLDLARRSAFPYLPSQILDGGNSISWAIAHNVSPEEARAMGAVRNIAEGQGTAVDAAQYFRDAKAKPEDLAKTGINLSKQMTRDALALQNLSDSTFHFVKVGELTPEQGVILGREIPSQRVQDDVFKWLKGEEARGKKVPMDELREVARDAADTAETTENQGQGGLFGEEYMRRSLFGERAKILSGVKDRLRSELRTYSNAVKNRARLEEAGNVLSPEENARRASEADGRLRWLDQKKKPQEVNDVLNQAANELAKNPRGKGKILDRAYEDLTKTVDSIRATQAQPEPPAEQGGLFAQAPPSAKTPKAPVDPGFTLGVSIPGGPQLARALEPEIGYWANRLAEGGKGLVDAFRRSMAPQMRGPLAKREAQIIVEARGEQAARAVGPEYLLRPLRDELEKIPEVQWRQRYADFYGPIQRGQIPAMVPPQMRSLIPEIRRAYDDRWNEIARLRQARGKQPMAYLDNYLTQAWADDPAKVRDTINQMGRLSGGPLTRGTPFFNQRKYLEVMDGMAAGLTPKFKNPMDQITFGLRQMDAYIAAETIFRNSYDAGLMRYFPAGTSEEGWKNVPDEFFNVMQYSPEAGGMVQRGRWRMPDEVVKVLDNHLSPSVAVRTLKEGMQRGAAGIGGWMLGKAGPGSAVARFNAFRVGFSAFHFINETNALLAQRQGTGLMRMMTGLLTADPSEIREGMAIFGKGTIGVPDTYDTFARGDKMMRALIEPGSQGAEYDRAIKAAITGGMRVRPEQVGTLSELMKRAAQDVLHPLARDARLGLVGDKPPITRGVGALLRTPGNLADLSSTALMNYYIPRIKLGAFYKLLSQELEHYNKVTGGNIPWAMQREIMQNTAAHVDSVFGQMVEDNLFMSRTMKDVMHLGIAYPGWNIGSGRLGLKAVQGLGRAVTFRPLDTQQRLALQFAMGLVTSQAMQGALLQRLLAGTWPKTIQDFYQPQDGGKDDLGNPTRISTPSYMRTYISAMSHPVSWAQNIANPIWGAIDDAVNNRDRFTGQQLWDPQAPLAKQAEQFAWHWVKFAAPFSESNIERLKQTGEGTARKTLGGLGYSPVSAQYLRTPAENYIMQQAGAHVPRVGLSAPQYAAKQTQRALEDALRQHKPMTSGQIETMREVPPALLRQAETNAAKAAELPRMVNLMRQRPLTEVLETYRIAQSTNDMKNEHYAKAVILDKWDRIESSDRAANQWAADLEKLDPGTAEKYRQMLFGILHPESAVVKRPPAPEVTGPEA